MKISHPLAAGLLLAAVGCQSSPHSLPQVPELAVEGRFDVVYTGTIGDPGLGEVGLTDASTPAVEVLPLALDEPGQAGNPTARSDNDWQPGLSIPQDSFGDPPIWEIQARVLRIDERKSNSWMLASAEHSGGGVQGWVVPQAAFEAWLQPNQGAWMESVTAPRLLLHDRAPGNLVISNQVAYIRRFHMERSAQALIADPEIGVLNSGLSIHLTPQGNQETGHLDFRVQRNRLLEMTELQAQLPFGSEVSLQYPLCLDERLEGQVQLSPEQVAILPGFLAEDGKTAYVALQLTSVELSEPEEVEPR